MKHYRVIENDGGQARIVGPNLNISIKHAQDVICRVLDVAYEAGCNGKRHPECFWIGDVPLCRTKGTLPPGLVAATGVDCKKCLSRRPA